MNAKRSRWNAFANHVIWTKMSGLFLVMIFILVVVGTFRWFFFSTTFEELLAEAGFVIAMIGVGMLKALNAKFKKIVEKGFAYYFYGTFVFLSMVGPPTFFLLVAKWTITDASPYSQYFILFLSTILWLILLATIIYEPWKQWLFTHFKSLGWSLPIVFFVNFFMVSVVLFSLVGYLYFNETDSDHLLVNAIPSHTNYDIFLSWFLWHVSDAVPVIKIPQTLGWDEPMKISDGPNLLSTWLLIFKIAVILPGIGGFKAYWSLRKQEKN